MKSADLPRFYRAVLTYHPAIETFRRGRGAWRVAACSMRNRKRSMIAPPRVVLWEDGVRRLHMDVTHQLRRNTFVNPTALLRVLLEQRRAAALFATAERVWEGPRASH